MPNWSPTPAVFAVAAGSEGESDLQGFYQSGWSKRQLGVVPGHHGPLLRRGFGDLATHQAVQARLRLCREAVGEEGHGAQSAGLAGHRSFSAVTVVPDLSGNKRHKKPEDDAQRGQKAGRDSLEGSGSLAHG